jgi:hypothetical protein
MRSKLFQLTSLHFVLIPQSPVVSGAVEGRRVVIGPQRSNGQNCWNSSYCVHRTLCNLAVKFSGSQFSLPAEVSW